MPLFIYTVFSSHFRNFFWYFHPLFYSSAWHPHLFLRAVLVFGKYEIHASALFHVSDCPLVFLLLNVWFLFSQLIFSFIVSFSAVSPIVSVSNLSHTSLMIFHTLFLSGVSLLVLVSVLGEIWEEVTLVFVCSSCSFWWIVLPLLTCRVQQESMDKKGHLGQAYLLLEKMLLRRDSGLCWKGQLGWCWGVLQYQTTVLKFARGTAWMLECDK